MKILIIKPSSLGDIVHALPTVNLIRHARTDAHIAWLINDTFAPILKNSPIINEVIPFPRAAFGKLWNLPRLLCYCWRLRKKNFDIAIDLQGLFRSGLFARVSGAPQRIGLSDAREGACLFYTDTVKLPQKPLHAVERYILALQALGIQHGPIAFPLPDADEDHRWVSDFLAQHSASRAKHLIAINPSARWETKRWPHNNFTALLDTLIRAHPHAKFVLLGSAADVSLANAIHSQTDPPRYEGVINVAGKTSLPQLVALLRRCDLLVTNDSGPMHIAAALRKPIVALFGPTDPVLVGPYAPDPANAPFTVLRADGPIENITVEQVAAAMQNRLETL